MELNLNNINPVKDLDRFLKVDEYEYWKFYLYMLNFRRPMLSDREIDLLAFVLAEDYYKPPFRRGNSTKAAKFLKISRVQVSHLKDSLETKGFLVFNEGDLFPAAFLRPLQKFVKFKLDEADFDIKLSFPFKIQKHGTNT